MPAAPRPALALALSLAAIGLAGCLTPHTKVHASQAVLDARARRDVTLKPACPQEPLATASPVQLSFGFDDPAMDATSQPLLTGAARWLACRQTPVAITPAADGQGTPAEQDRLARQRAEVVANYLASHGVIGNRIQILPRGQAAPGGEIFLIRAEGRRW